MFNPYESPQSVPERASFWRRLRRGYQRGCTAIRASLQREKLSKSDFLRSCAVLFILLPAMIAMAVALIVALGLQVTGLGWQ